MLTLIYLVGIFPICSLIAACANRILSLKYPMYTVHVKKLTEDTAKLHRVSSGFAVLQLLHFKGDHEKKIYVITRKLNL